MPHRWESRRQTLVNTLSSWAEMVAQGIVGLVTVPFLLTSLTEAGFGALCVLNLIIVYASYIDIGIRSGIGRDLTEAAVRNDPGRFTSLVVTSCAINTALALVGMCLMYVIAEPLVALLGVPAAVAPNTAALLPWYCGTLLLVALIQPIFSAALNSFNRYEITHLLRLGTSLIPPVVAIPRLESSGRPLLVWCSVTAVSQLALLCLTAIAAVYVCQRLLIAPVAFRTGVRDTMNFGFRIFATQFSSMLGSQSDTWAISAFKGSTELALYNPASRVASLARPFVAVLANTLQSSATARFTNADCGQLAKLLLIGTRYQMLLGGLAFASLATCSFDFCRLWLGGSLGDKYITVACLLIAMACVDVLEYAAGTQWPVLVGMRQVDYLLKTQIPFTVLNIALTIGFVAYSPLGMYGALLATAIANGIRRPLICIHAAGACGITAQKYFLESYLRPIVVGGVTTAFGVALAITVESSTWLHLFNRVLVLAGAWALSALLIGLTRDERDVLYEYGLAIVTPVATLAQQCGLRVCRALRISK
jgi:O-antigen/teichoic acid export membrane protein